jgi:hypothetical protein
MREVLLQVDMKAFLAERADRKARLEAQQEYEQRSEEEKQEEEKGIMHTLFHIRSNHRFADLREEVGEVEHKDERIEFLKHQRYLISQSELLSKTKTLQLPKGPPAVLQALLRVLSIELPAGAKPHLVLILLPFSTLHRLSECFFFSLWTNAV